MTAANPPAATVGLVGDLVPTRPLFDDNGAPYEPGTGDVAAVLAGADLVAGCLLPPLSERGRPTAKLIAIRTPPERCADLSRLGFGLIHLANNHIMDYGDQALADTIETLAAAGIDTIGAGPDLAAATHELIVERAGVRIGLLAWSTLLPTGAQAGVERAGIAPLPVHVSYEIDQLYLTEEPTYPPAVRSRVDEPALAEVCQRIGQVRSEVDVLIVAMHWGEGVGDRIAEYQPVLGRALIAAGADVVWGTHPHSVQAIKVHQGKPILYSPGLFLDQTPREGISAEEAAVYAGMSPDSYIALLDLEPGGLIGLRIVPTTRGRTGDPTVAAGEDFDRIADRLRSTSGQFGTRLSVTGGAITVLLGSDPA